MVGTKPMRWFRLRQADTRSRSLGTVRITEIPEFLVIPPSFQRSVKLESVL
jgi:hypothetical protein